MNTQMDQHIDIHLEFELDLKAGTSKLQEPDQTAVPLPPGMWLDLVGLGTGGFLITDPITVDIIVTARVAREDNDHNTNVWVCESQRTAHVKVTNELESVKLPTFSQLASLADHDTVHDHVTETSEDRAR